MSPKELSAFVKVMRKEGVLKLTAGDLSIELAHDAISPKIKQLKNSSQKDIIETEEYSHEEVLLWSAGVTNAQGN